MTEIAFNLDDTLKKLYEIHSEIDCIHIKLKTMKNEKQRKKRENKKTDYDTDIKKIRSDAMKDAHNKIKEFKERKNKVD